MSAEFLVWKYLSTASFAGMDDRGAFLLTGALALLQRVMFAKEAALGSDTQQQ